MPIIEWPKDNQDNNKEQCAICSRRAPIEEMAIGPCVPGLVQILVCSSHICHGESAYFLRVWADFTDSNQTNDIKEE